MIIKLFDRTEIVVSQDEAAKVVNAIERDVASIVVKGIFLNNPKRVIAYVMPGGYTEADRADKSHRIAATSTHRGEYSPAKERIREMFRNKHV